MERFIVMTSGARTSWKAQQFGVYKNVAVVETDCLGTPKMITPRAKHLVRIVKHYGKLNVGTTERCAYQVALRRAAELAAELNATAEPASCPTCGQQLVEERV